MGGVGATAERITFAYYDVGNRTLASNSAGAYTFGVRLTMAYDASGNRVSVADGFDGTVTSSFDALDWLSAREIGGSGLAAVRQTRSYTGSEMVAAETDQKWSGSTWVSVLYSTYTYDGNDRVTAFLHRHALGSIVYNAWVSDAYTYDAADRLTSQTINGATATFGYDGVDQLTDDNGVALAYDLNGNRTMAGYSMGRTTG